MSDIWDEAEDAMRAVQRQARRDQIEGELEGYRHHLAGRSLVEMVWESMQRGDAITIRWVGGSAQGIPIAVAGDLVLLDTRDGRLGVNLAVVALVEVTEPRSTSGSIGDGELGSFVAFSRMIEGLPVRVVMVGGQTVDGTLVTTAKDHLLITTVLGREAALVISDVAGLLVETFAFPF